MGSGRTPIDLAVVLAAGASTRMGRSKPLLDLQGRPLVARQVDALAPYARRVVVVVGAEAAAVAAALPPGTPWVENPDFATSWPADSLRLALRAFPEARTAWVTPVDVLPPLPETLRRLAAAGPPAVPVDPAGRRGHPALLGPELLDRLREAAPAGGLAALLGDAREVPVDDPDVACDFDDPAAWARARRRSGSRPR